MATISDTLTMGIVLSVILGSLFFYLYTRLLQVEKRISLTENILLDLKMATENTLLMMGSGGGGGGESMYESQAQLDPEVEEFLEGLTPDDVGRDDVGDYIVHYEGFTDQCQDSQEYQDDPEAVFNDVWGDFKRRMGDKDPINYGIVGSEDYPIVYSVFRR